MEPGRHSRSYRGTVEIERYRLQVLDENYGKILIHQWGMFYFQKDIFLKKRGKIGDSSADLRQKGGTATNTEFHP